MDGITHVPEGKRTLTNHLSSTVTLRWSFRSELSFTSPSRSLPVAVLSKSGSQWIWHLSQELGSSSQDTLHTRSRLGAIYRCQSAYCYVMRRSEETREPGGDPCRHEESIHTDSNLSSVAPPTTQGAPPPRQVRYHTTVRSRGRVQSEAVFLSCALLSSAAFPRAARTSSPPASCLLTWCRS